jgi:hypothetical protein
VLLAVTAVTAQTLLPRLPIVAADFCMETVNGTAYGALWKFAAAYVAHPALPKLAPSSLVDVCARLYPPPGLLVLFPSSEAAILLKQISYLTPGAPFWDPVEGGTGSPTAASAVHGSGENLPPGLPRPIRVWGWCTQPRSCVAACVCMCVHVCVHACVCCSPLSVLGSCLPASRRHFHPWWCQLLAQLHRVYVVRVRSMLCACVLGWWSWLTCRRALTLLTNTAVDTVSQSNSFCPTMTIGRSQLGAATVGDLVFAIGG